MTQIDHPNENPVSRLAIAVAKEICSAMLPGSGLVFSAVNEFIRKKIETATQLLRDEFAAGARELNDLEKDEFVPMAYLFFKAAEEGISNRNLRLLAKLLHEEIASPHMLFDNYAEAANLAKFLTINEIVALTVILKKSESAGNAVGLALVLEDIDDDMVRDYPSFFPERNRAVFALSSLSGKGLLVPVVIATVGESFPSYCPTDLALRLGKLAKGISA